MQFYFNLTFSEFSVQNYVAHEFNNLPGVAVISCVFSAPSSLGM